MLLSFLLLSKLSSTVCSLSLKTPSFSLPDTRLFSPASCFASLLLPSFSSSNLLLFLPPSPPFSALYLLFCFFPHLSPSTHLSLPLSSLSPSPLCRPHQLSRSLVSLSLGWHREQPDTWEGCFVIQQVIPPWQREGGGGGWGWWDAERKWSGRENLAGLYYYLPTYTFAASLRLQADGLSLFFLLTTGGLALLHLPSAFNFEEQEGGRKETRKEMWQWKRDEMTRKGRGRMWTKGKMNRGGLGGGRDSS